MTHHEHDLALEGKRAAVAVGPLYEEIEALYPLYRLREAGATVLIIGAEANATLAGKRGDEITTERAAGDLSADDLRLRWREVRARQPSALMRLRSNRSRNARLKAWLAGEVQWPTLRIG